MSALLKSRYCRDWRLSSDDLHTLKSLIVKFLPSREGVYSYELGDGYIIHYFTFNEEQMLEMAESPFKAQPYANWMVNEIWILADGMGSNMGKPIGKFILAFRTSVMAYDALEDGWPEMMVVIRSRNDEEGKWALEFCDTLSEVWRKLTGK